MTSLILSLLLAAASPLSGMTADNHVCISDSVAQNDSIASFKEAERLREAFRKKIEQTNPVGATASDFRIVTREGHETTLLSLDSDKEILLIFYNPDCDTCHETIHEISQSGLDQKYNVVAIDAEEDREEWDSTASTLPAGWTVTFALDPIQDEETYFLLDSPTLYLLSPDKTILLKDFPLSSLY